MQSYNLSKFLIITILVLTAYLPTFSGDFILDDKALVKNNQFIRDSHTLLTYFSQEDGVSHENDLGAYHSGYYRPLINITYRLDYLLWGMDARGFRTTNLILHLICCFILMYFFSLFLEKNVAFWAAVIFALHPVNTEAVSFITSRNNIIVTIFSIGSLLSFIIANENKKIFAYIISVVLFAGAVFSKEFGLMVIPLIFFYRRLLAEKKYGFLKESISYLPFILVAIIYFLLRKGVTESVLAPSGIENIWEGLFFAPFLVFCNLKLVLLPNNLHFFNLDYPEIIYNWLSIISFILFFLLLILLWKKRRNKVAVFSVLAFLTGIIPVLNIIPTSSVSLISMRWLYFPMAFLFLGVGCIIKNAIIWRKNISISILTIVVSYMGAYTYSLNRGLWHDNDALIKQEVFRFNNMMFASDIAEKYLNNKQYKEAEEYYNIAIDKYPNRAINYIDYSYMLIETNRLDDAVKILNKASSLIMTHYEQGRWYNNMGMAMWKKGNNVEALKFFQKAVKVAPEEVIFWSDLGGVYGAIGKYEESVKVLKHGIALSPDSIELRTNLAMSYINLKDYINALSTLEEISENERNTNKKILMLMEKAKEGLKKNQAY
ncbi:MAG: tetratricopeptide repeat protein [Bacteroidales bacterium]|nr:tetratricopeptide repeat protein [Bacteroidales bacterium]